ncbi:MAG: 23S rRNA (adenine(2503)-C(2))-methyltransferase RlmN, partial [Acidimicrobiales bacterium]
AVSLHAANDALRDKLVPLNSRYPLKTLIDACKTYIERTGRRISFEWAVIGGVNDSPRDARELAELALGLGAHVNLIALNPTSGFEAPKPSRAPGFARLLKGLGVNVTVRATRGRRIGAACGQLAYEHSKRAPGASVPIRAPRAREPGAPTS